MIRRDRFGDGLSPSNYRLGLEKITTSANPAQNRGRRRCVLREQAGRTTRTLPSGASDST
jgi:hypothetical protein